VRKFNDKIEEDISPTSKLAYLEEKGAEGWELVAAAQGGFGSNKYILKKKRPEFQGYSERRISCLPRQAQTDTQKAPRKDESLIRPVLHGLGGRSWGG
jgi:hypothetical protein